MIAGDERERGGGGGGGGWGVAEVAVNPEMRILKSEKAIHRSSVK